ncbi:hypothetical protein BOX15_Mlig026063g3 [Macrostomum lignano]|uniref:Importin N-terminal domain-containing protein n=1 Tax=Macrostomum lignano TaxID=282301 RepID=A0A267FU62_9PLAT|nr:hypothetical protein BOX15_Mlig026063g3 [Macrostomum lignano]
MLNSGSLAAWCSSVVNQGHVPRLEELESMQSSPNFVAELLPIIAEHPSNEVRLLASICIKNLVRLRWRFKVTPEDKSLIREAALRLHSQQLPAATQLAMTAGLVARFDWPERWPDLMTSLSACLTDPSTAGNEQWQSRSLLLLHHIVKALMSKTLPKHRQQFRSVSCDLVPFLIGRLVPRLQSLAASCSTGAAPSCDIWCTVLYTKCCTNLISHGLASLSTPSGDNSPVSLLGCVIECLPTLALNSPDAPLEPLVTSLGRLLLRCQTHAPQAFAQLMEPAVKLAVGISFGSDANWPNNDSSAEYRDRRINVQCLNLISQCVQSYGSPAPDAGDQLHQASQTLNELLTDAALDALVFGLLRRHLASTSDELDEALTQPDEAVFAQTPEKAHLLSGRHAGEALLQSLLQELPQRALAAVQRIVEAQLNSAANSTASPRELEATLTLLASCPYDLAKCVRFPDLCQACNILPMLLQVDDESNHQWSLLLKRRAVMLLAAWADVPDALPTELFGAACQSAASLMSPSRHPLLRLQAARLAHSLLTSLNLDANAFQPHAADCFSGLAGLLAQVRSDQAQVHLLTVVASFLRYSVADLRPCLPALVPHLPGMWDSAGGDQARLAVLSVLCELAKLGDLSLGHLALPLAHACLTGPDLFWEGGLHLLLYLLCHLHTYPEQDCFAQSLACLHSRIAERACMEAPERRLLQVCAYLDCDRYLAAHGAALLAACQACLAVPGCCSSAACSLCCCATIC